MRSSVGPDAATHIVTLCNPRIAASWSRSLEQPRCSRIVRGGDQLELEARRIRADDCRVAESLFDIIAGDALFRETGPPHIQRTGRHREGRRDDLADALPADRHAAILIGERRPERARRAPLVAVVEVVDVMVVEVDGLLDQAQTEQPDAEVEVVLRGVDGRGDVVQAENRGCHLPHDTPVAVTA